MNALYRFIPKGDTVHHEREWKQNQATGPTSRMKDRVANGTVYKTSKPTINDISSPISNHPLKGSRCPQRVTLPRGPSVQIWDCKGHFILSLDISERGGAPLWVLSENGWSWARLERGRPHSRGCHCGPRAIYLEGGANSALNKSLLNERMNESYHPSAFQKVKKSTLGELALSLLHS